MNQVFSVVAAAQLPPLAFRWMSQLSGPNLVSRLEHKDSNFYYLFDFELNQYEGVEAFARYSPGDRVRVVQEFVGAWDGHSSHVVAWLKNLARELKAPNLWSAAEQLATSAAEIDRNEPFSMEERRVIGEQLRSIRQSIEQLRELDEAEEMLLDRRLKYLESAAGRVGRFDWRGLVVSVVFNIAWDPAYNPEQARALFGFFAGALANVVQGLPRLPL